MNVRKSLFQNLKKLTFYQFFNLAEGLTPKIKISALSDHFLSIQHKKLQCIGSMRTFSVTSDFVESNYKNYFYSKKRDFAIFGLLRPQ
jgi:hypothetical protein